MPRLLDTASRADSLVRGMNAILVTQGVFGLTLRTIARESGISTGSLMHHFEHRERMLGVAAHRTGRALLEDIRVRSYGEGVAAFLPGDDDGVLLTRAWLAWCELWRSEERLLHTVEEVRRERREELRLLAEVHEFGISRPDLDLLTATVDGLRTAVCAPVRPMPPTRARDLLRTASRAAVARAA